MTRRRRGLLAALPIILALGAAVALAYWTTSGSGSASATVGTLSAPTGVIAAATPGSGTVAITWTASAPAGGLSPQGYYVLRHASGGATSPACGSSPGSLVTGTSCSDASVADGTYTYTVVARYRSWTASSAASDEATVTNDDTPPTAQITFPADSAVYADSAAWNAGCAPDGLCGTAADTQTGVSLVEISIRRGAGGPYWNGTSFGDAGESFHAATGTTAWDYALALPGDGTYTVRARATDGSANTTAAAAYASTTFVVDTTAPATTIATDPASPDGADGWFRQSSVSFTLSASDATSGVADRFYTLDGGATQTYGGAVAITAPGTHTVTYWSHDNAGNVEAAKSATVKLDGAAPSTTIATIPATPDGTASWFKQSSVSFTLAATDATSGAAGRFYAIDGAGTQAYGGAVAIGMQGDHTVEYWSTDAAGNVEARNTTHVKLDGVGPANALSLTDKTGGGSFLSGSTVYYQGTTAGSLRIQNAVSDATSGAASSAFAALGGTATGWTHAAPDVQSTPAGGPYVSNAFGWGAGTSSAPTEVVTGADAAGNATAASSLTFTNDSTAPAGGAIGYPNAFVAALSVPVTTDAGSDGASGVDAASGIVQRDQAAPDASGGCGAFPATFATTVALAGGADTGVASNTCYRYRYRISDRVGNQATYTSGNVAKVDATAPTPSSVQAANGKTSGQIDHNGSNVANWDKLTFTYADAFGVAPGSIASGWDGNGTRSVSVTFTDGGPGNDTITVPGIGTVDLGSGAWLTSTSTKDETLTKTAFNQFRISIGLDPSGNASGVAASDFTWGVAGGTAQDAAGNAASGSVQTAGQRF